MVEANVSPKKKKRETDLEYRMVRLSEHAKFDKFIGVLALLVF